MAVWIKIFNLIYVLIEVLYPITCIVVMRRILRYNKMNPDCDNTLPTATLFFLGFCVLGIISHNKGVIEVFGQIPFTLFLIAEISYLWFVMKLSLKNFRLQLLFTILLVALMSTIPFLASQEYKETLYDPLFAIESLIASSISFAYFTQLGDEIKTKNVLKDPITLVMLGLFFCYSLPFAYNTTIAAINIIEPTLFIKIKTKEFDRFLLITISRVGTICYIILNIFFFKAFKWKPKAQIGI